HSLKISGLPAGGRKRQTCSGDVRTDGSHTCQRIRETIKRRKCIMKKLLLFKTSAVLALAIYTPRGFAQLNVASDGSDGALNITTNTVIDLSKATTGIWSQHNSPNAGNGVYDSSKWAVVFKYSSVSIAINAMVTFLNHPSHAPVVWLVQSGVD